MPSRNGSPLRARAGRHSTAPATRRFRSKAKPCAPSLTGRSIRRCSMRSRPGRLRPVRARVPGAEARGLIRGRGTEMFGKLTWDAIPWGQPIPLVAGAAVILVVLGVLAWVVVKGYLPYLWREWITSVDHKRIGVMYTLLGAVMQLRGFIDAIMMRSQQAVAFRAAGYLPPEHFDQ